MGNAIKIISTLEYNRTRTVMDLSLSDRLRSAVLSAKEIMYEWDIADNKLYLLSEMGHTLKEQLHGVVPAWDARAFPGLIHFEDKRLYLNHLRSALRNGDGHDELLHKVEIRLRGEPGTWHWISISGRVTERNADHRALRMAGTFFELERDMQQYRHAALWHEQGHARASGFHAQANIETSRPLLTHRDRQNSILDNPIPSCLESITRRSYSFTKQDHQRTLHTEISAQHTNNAIRYRQLIESSPEAIIVCTEYKLSFLNRAACRLFGVQTPSRLLGRDILQLIGPAYRKEFHEHVDSIVHGESRTHLTEQQWQRIDQSTFDAEVSASLTEFAESTAVQLVIRDVSERKRSEIFQADQCSLLNLMATGATLSEILTKLSHVIERQISDAQCAILHLDAQGKPVLHPRGSPIPPVVLGEFAPIFLHSTAGIPGTPVQMAVCIPNPDGESTLHPAQHHAMPQHDSRLSALQPIIGREGKTIGAIAVYGEGISTLSPWQKHVLEACVGLACVAIESRTVDEHIRYLAHYDGLTSLPNRFLFKEYLEQALVEARKRRQKFAVLFLDLDKFKEVNDRFGHEAGDEVLRQIANRMRACLRHTDKIARMGGDEFYVLIDALHDSRYAADVAQKLLQAASRPVEAAGKMHQLSVSIGISIYPNDGHDTQSLLQKADTAMYRAKEMGKDGFAFFSSAQINGD